MALSLRARRSGAAATGEPSSTTGSTSSDTARTGKQDARHAYRTVAERYRHSSLDEVAKAVRAALTGEWNASVAAGDSDAALAVCEYAACALAESERPTLQEFAAGCLYNAAAECGKRGEPARGIAFCRELERRYGAAPTPAVFRIVVAGAFLGGKLAKTMRDPQTALEFFARAGAEQPEAQDYEALQTVAWARLELAGCYAFLAYPERARAECAALVEAFGNETLGEEFHDQVVCASLLGCMCDMDLGVESASEELVALIQHCDGNPNAQVRWWSNLAHAVLGQHDA